MDTVTLSILIGLLLLAGFIAMMIYTTALQKKAVGTQDKAFTNQQESVEKINRSLLLQEKSIQLAEETNALLRELIAKFPAR